MLVAVVAVVVVVVVMAVIAVFNVDSRDGCSSYILLLVVKMMVMVAKQMSQYKTTYKTKLIF